MVLIFSSLGSPVSLSPSSFVQVIENLESCGNLEFYFPGPEKSWKLVVGHVKVMRNDGHCTNQIPHTVFSELQIELLYWTTVDSFQQHLTEFPTKVRL